MKKILVINLVLTSALYLYLFFILFFFKDMRLGAEVLSTASSDTLTTFRTNVNTSLSNLQASSTNWWVSGTTMYATTSNSFLGSGTTTPKTRLVVGGTAGTDYFYTASSSIMLQSPDGNCHILRMRNGTGGDFITGISGLSVATMTCP